jgi:methionyl aminopeptidase
MLSKIGQTIQSVADIHHCGVVTQFVGHGVGIKYHEPPQVPHHSNQMKIPLAPGMIFTIEPMINFGTPDLYVDPDDKWTARTLDGKPSAQWEHTLLITTSGVEILTPWQPTYCFAEGDAT